MIELFMYCHMMIQIINVVMSSQFGYMHPQIKYLWTVWQVYSQQS